MILGFLIAFLLFKNLDTSIFTSNIANIKGTLEENHINYLFLHFIIISFLLASSLIMIGIILFLGYFIFESASISFSLLSFYQTFKIKGLFYGIIYNIINKLIFIICITLIFKKINVKSNNGRFINEADVKMMRKVIVLSPRMAEVLFRGKNALGEYVRCGSFMFQVVGTYEDENNSNNSPAYIPFSVAQQLYNKGYGFGSLNFTLKGVNTEAENDAFEEKFRGWMARRHQFDPTDENAIGMWNLGSEFRSFNTMMAGINLFIWIIGIGTLMAGIVGVSNIMLITVRERTKEFGIRKAIGAKPSSILMLIITESIMVTAVFGYIGMIMGIGLTEMINYGMETAQAAQSAVESSNTVGGNVSTFRDPTVNISIAISSTILIIVAGVLAGYFPARKAVKIPAVEAMRAE